MHCGRAECKICRNERNFCKNIFFKLSEQMVSSSEGLRWCQLEHFHTFSGKGNAEGAAWLMITFRFCFDICNHLVHKTMVQHYSDPLVESAGTLHGDRIVKEWMHLICDIDLMSLSFSYGLEVLDTCDSSPVCVINDRV